MSIVLNEYEWAENAIHNRDLGKKPSETLGRVAKYYLYKNYSKNDTRKKVEEFLVQCDPSASVISWSDSIDRIMKYAQKYPIVMIDHISVTRPELETISSLEGKQLKRLAFTLLCIAKFMNTVSPQNEYWVNTPDNEIMKMANINTSIKRQSMMFSQLKDLGLIRFSKKIDNLSVQVKFVSAGDEEIRITDFRNLGYQYLKYLGEPYFECECCGITVKNNSPNVGRKLKYCADCAAIVKMKQNVNSVMKSRSTQI